MSQLIGKLNSVGEGRLLFYCPGCKMAHPVRYGPGNGPRWSWNGDGERATFSPSILVSYAWGEKREERRCHSFVRDGQIQFLSDCTHPLAGQTVELPAFKWGEGDPYEVGE